VKKMLNTDAELFAAALFQHKVYVVQIVNDITVIFPGIIEKITPLSVQVNGESFSRIQHLFYVTSEKEPVS
jgi:hypothetical protein